MVGGRPGQNVTEFVVDEKLASGERADGKKALAIF
jgi:hypothetical protein